MLSDRERLVKHTLDYVKRNEDGIALDQMSQERRDDFYHEYSAFVGVLNWGSRD